jgi:phage-related protein
MIRDTRPISWIKAARKDFEAFPEGARLEIERALTLAAEGRKADFAKPMQGLGSGVFEVALQYKGEAYRVVYAVQLGPIFGSSMPSKRNRKLASKRHR